MTDVLETSSRPNPTIEELTRSYLTNTPKPDYISFAITGVASGTGGALIMGIPVDILQVGVVGGLIIGGAKLLEKWQGRMNRNNALKDAEAVKLGWFDTQPRGDNQQPGKISE